MNNRYYIYFYKEPHRKLFFYDFCDAFDFLKGNIKYFKLHFVEKLSEAKIFDNLSECQKCIDFLNIILVENYSIGLY